ncbi:esterase-like activity of phytase family protein [Leptolyngbya ohadii]|uniref:esterase-like activity of phytase family protein n=1 Tax=Leptolyngbya ohadii TaxID=1962290 RepID=UPI000B5991BF|nr:esterase-like activity of phytase family protein [Leptolyngbya ohadii]
MFRSFCFPRLFAPLGIVLCTIVFLTGCSLSEISLPQIKAEDRLFLPLSLEYLGEYQLPKGEFEGTTVGGVSGIAYDRQQDRFYAVSDDRSERAPARFYTLKLDIQEADSSGEPSAIGIRSVEIEKVTTLKGEDGQPYTEGTIDLEGIALSPRRTLFVISEGVTQEGIPPFIDEFDLESGNWRRKLAVPKRFVPHEEDGQPAGVQNNRGFEALTVNASGAAPNSTEPYRLFTATEAAIVQDLAPKIESQIESTETNPATVQPLRFLHYLVSDELPTLLAEHLYLIDPPSGGATENGLVELVSLDQGGHFVSLERSFGVSVGVGAKLFQLAIGGATDTSGIPYLHGDVEGIVPISKRLLLDLNELDIPLDNVEGMAIGPQLPDGSQSLILVSDDNFNPLQVTQFLLFRLKG